MSTVLRTGHRPTRCARRTFPEAEGTTSAQTVASGDCRGSRAHDPLVPTGRPMTPTGYLPAPIRAVVRVSARPPTGALSLGLGDQPRLRWRRYLPPGPGSSHGYDVVDPTRLNPELGGEAEFRAMAAAFRRHGLGLILDIVPNHMGIGGDSNRYWLDVLRWGPQSRFARWFDIDWNAADPRLRGKVLVPILGESYRKALAGGALELRFDPIEGSFAVWAHDAHKLPVCPRSYGRILRSGGLGGPGQCGGGSGRGGVPTIPAGRRSAANLPATPPQWRSPRLRSNGRPDDPASWDRLDALIAVQFWRPAKFTPRERSDQLPPVLRHQRPRGRSRRGPGSLRGDARTDPRAGRGRPRRRAARRSHRRAARPEGLPPASQGARRRGSAIFWSRRSSHPTRRCPQSGASTARPATSSPTC